MSETLNIRSLVVFPRLRVGPVQIEKKRIKAPYELTLASGETVENELIYTYEEAVFDPQSRESQNLAAFMSAQVALNYGLFCEEIEFHGLFDDTDRKFLANMMENTSREIFVNKFLFPNEFLKPPFDQIPAQKQKAYTAAKLSFIGGHEDEKFRWEFNAKEDDKYLILSSGGKDSLLSYGLMKELGKSVHPVFINESGRHWFTAINAYRDAEEKEPNTGRVWCNCDRIYTWMLKQMPFIRPNFADIRADIYPVRLWTVAVFLVGSLPLAHKRNIRRLVIGDEYDTTVSSTHQGISHYNGLYDQSKYFDNALSRYYLKKGWQFQQFSLLRSLSELLILKILVKRYPELQKEQVSCHAAHEKEGRIYPCGKCEKCRRIVGMLTVLEEDPARCGYTPQQITDCLKSLETKTVKQIGSDAAHLYHLLVHKKVVAKDSASAKMAKEHPEIMQLRFDRERSSLADLPQDIRQGLFSIYLDYADGAVLRQNRKWEPLDLHNSDVFHTPYAFEMDESANMVGASGVLWAELTWEELGERLKVVDTVIVPCGAIEQHGPHLPVDVDHYDAVYLAKKVAEACSMPKPLVVPGIPFGVSYHHEDFPGTLSVTNDALSRFVYDLGMSLAKNGIKKIILLNGHGDNAPTLTYAAQMINRDAEIFVCVETGETSDEEIDAMIDTPNDIHAGEIETSTTLALRPHLVKMDRAINETLRFGSQYLDFSGGGVPWYVRTKKISNSGVMGDPTKATAEKGREMWDVMISHLVKFVEEIKQSNLEDLYQKRY